MTYLCTYCYCQFGKFTGLTGMQYADGRTICQNCHKTAIKTSEQLQCVWDFAALQIKRLGFSVELEKVPVTLLNQDAIYSQFNMKNICGLAISEVSTFKGDTQSEIIMLYGVPMVHAVGILAHEAMHVYCRQHGMTYTSDEEGFCEYVAYLILLKMGSADAKELVQNMLDNPEEIYGGGLRKYIAKAS